MAGLKIGGTRKLGPPYDYTVCIYWIFRGKVKLDRMSY